jgi:hypothetical protein
MVMQRRHLLGALSVAAIAATWSRLLRADTPYPRLAERLVGTLRQPKSAARIGRAFLAAHPSEAEVERLTDKLAEDLCRHCRAPERLCPVDLRALFSRQVWEDFATGRVMRVDGWILSATEARLCGLTALVGMGPAA